MMKFLTAPWMTIPAGVVVYAASTFLFWKTPVLPPPAAAAARSTPNGPSWEFTNPEADQLIIELRDEKRLLDLRKQQLDETASRLQAERSEMALVTQSVRKLQDDFDKAVVRAQEAEVPNLKKLAKICADMAPETATSMLSQMDDAKVVKIMMFMKENEAAGILESLAKKDDAGTKRAATLSDLLRLATAHK